MIGRHWRGETPVVTAVLGVGIVGSLLLVALGRLLLTIANQFELPLSVGSAIDLIWFASCILIWTWVVVGIWRASNRATRQAKLGARLFVVISSLALVPTAIASTKAVAELARLAAGRDPMGAPASISLSRDRLILKGILAEGTTAAVGQSIRNSHASTIVLDSLGGRIAEAEQIATLVKHRKFDTRVEGVCASACTLILLAGAHRTLIPGGRVGFHQSTFPGNGATDDDFLTEQVRSYFRNGGVSEAFISRAFSTSAKAMWYPTEDEMLESGVLNQRGIHALLEESLPRIRSSLPRKIDKITTWKSVDLRDSTLIYHYEVLLPNSVYRSIFQQKQATALIKQTCRDDGLKYLVQQGAILQYDYVNASGSELGAVTVSHCSLQTAAS